MIGSICLNEYFVYLKLVQTGRHVDIRYTFGLISNSYIMGCSPVRGDNPRALASGLSYVQVDKHGITILYHLHQCRPCTLRNIRAKVGQGGIKGQTSLIPVSRF